MEFQGPLISGSGTTHYRFRNAVMLFKHVRDGCNTLRWSQPTELRHKQYLNARWKSPNFGMAFTRSSFFRVIWIYVLDV